MPTMSAAICEECGLRKEDWKENLGRGFPVKGVGYCCRGCFEGIGCTCKETGVRRVVVVNQQENKQTYVKKMDRQMKEWRGKIKDLEGRAKARQAEKNTAVHQDLSELRRRVEETRSKLKGVKSGGQWPQSSRSVSESYRKMKQSARSASSRIKQK